MNCNVINLDRRPDRWVIVREQLHDLDFHVTRFTGIDNGWRGCGASHLQLLQEGLDHKFLTIFEDDILFLWTHPIPMIIICMEDLPPDWDCMYLGASPKEPQVRYSDNLFRLKNAHTTHGIIWHNREGGAVEYILSHKKDIGKIDNYMATVIQPKFNCFVTAPMLATQRQTQSDTCKRADTSTIIKNYNRYCI